MTTTSEFPDFHQHFLSSSNGSGKLCAYTSDPPDQTVGKPTLVLIHGYPQSSYMYVDADHVPPIFIHLSDANRWRHIAPVLAKHYPLFIVDLPGYGYSSKPPANEPYTKLVAGSTIISALTSHTKSTSNDPLPIILISHDRGARVAHRIAVSRSLFPAISLLGLCTMDIVPTTEQWRHFSSVPDVVGYFHWPFLVNWELARDMINAYGGDKWVLNGLDRTGGKDKLARERLTSGNAFETYAAHFRRADVVESSCRDYAAAAKEDLAAQEEDQKVGRKVDVPLLIMYSEAGLGSRFDVKETWKAWVAEGTDVWGFGVGDGAGHYLPEEAPVLVVNKLLEWMEELAIVKS